MPHKHFANINKKIRAMERTLGAPNNGLPQYVLKDDEITHARADSVRNLSLLRLSCRLPHFKNKQYSDHWSSPLPCCSVEIFFPLLARRCSNRVPSWLFLGVMILNSRHLFWPCTAFWTLELYYTYAQPSLPRELRCALTGPDLSIIITWLAPV